MITYDLVVIPAAVYQIPNNRQSNHNNTDARRSVSIDGILEGHIIYPADSTAKLCQGGKGRYVGREGVPMDNSSGENVNL